MNSDKPSVPAQAIEVSGLEKSFGENHALRGIDLDISRGECLVIFGPNGAGKTTLLKVIATLLKPSAGKVFLDGTDIRKKAVQIRRKLSLVSHQTFLYDDLTVYENLRFYGRMYGVPGLEEKIREVASWVQLESRLHDRVGTLSHGLQQRASIARAVIHNPSMVFLDEPEVGLDPQATTVVSDVLGRLNTDNRTVVMTTHNLERGLELGDSFVILDRGKVVYQAARDEIDTGSFKQVYDRCTGTGR